jgi:hypothetical protein
MLALHARRKARSRISVTVAAPVVAVLGGPSSSSSKADIGSTLWCLAAAVLSNQLSVLFASRAALASAFFTPSSRCPPPPLASPAAALLPPLHAPASPHALASGIHPSLSLSAHDHASKALSSRRVLFHSPPESSLTPHPRIFILPSHERSRRRFHQRRNRKAEF